MSILSRQRERGDDPCAMALSCDFDNANEKFEIFIVLHGVINFLACHFWNELLTNMVGKVSLLSSFMVRCIFSHVL